MSIERTELSDDVYMTVVALCKGYRRRQKRIEEAKNGGDVPPHILRKDRELNQIIDISLIECCQDNWMIPDLIECIGDQTGYRKYRHNDRTAKRYYEQCKRESIAAIARRLSLI